MILRDLNFPPNLKAKTIRAIDGIYNLKKVILSFEFLTFYRGKRIIELGRVSLRARPIILFSMRRTLLCVSLHHNQQLPRRPRLRTDQGVARIASLYPDSTLGFTSVPGHRPLKRFVL